MIETRLSPAFEFKFAGGDAAGSFSGYASTFNGPVDAYGDLISAGSFKDSLAAHKAAGTVPAMLFSHMTAEPIGRWTSIKEDPHGLHVEGKLTLGTQRGQEVRALMQDDALGLSIGFRINPGGVDYQGQNRILKSLDLVEISAVSIPANPAAKVTGVKSAAGLRPDNIRDFEAALRDTCGFSHREAKRIASAGWTALLRRDDASDELQEIAALLCKAATDFQISR